MGWHGDRELPQIDDELALPEASTRWRLAAGITLHHHGWDGQYVLYNDLSGSTHQLGAAALAVLTALATRPHTTAELAALLCAHFGLAPSAGDAAEAADLLDALALLHLVVPEPC
jgi:PqqD family protein of HPr-rel-A system